MESLGGISQLDELNNEEEITYMDETNAAQAKIKRISKSNTTSKTTKSTKTKKTSLNRASPPRKKKSTRNSTNLQNDLRQIVSDLYGYEIKDFDLDLIGEIFTQLSKLNEIWSRIGFNHQTKQDRLERFYTEVFTIVDEIIESEEELEEKIIHSIEQQLATIKEHCFELQIRFDDLKQLKTLSEMTIIDQDELLRKEAKNLHEEKKKRMNEYRKLIQNENELCEKLRMKKSDMKSHVPSESEIKSLETRIHDLQEFYEERKREMHALKDEIVQLSNELETSRSDSFAEMIIYESLDDLKMGEEDLRRAIEFRDDLKRRNVEIVDQIKHYRSKIKELWSKLNLEPSSGIESEPEMLKQMVYDEQEFGQTFAKRHLLNELTSEYERCFRIKMENMQKFIEGIRAEIKEFLEKMFIGDSECQSITVQLFSKSDFNEDLLTEHEKKLEDLKFCYEESQSLYEKVTKWMELWEEYMQFEEKTKDPQRFKQRGYNMLEEERQRKVFKVQLPKLEDEIVQLAQEYTENCEKEFTVYGMNFMDFMNHKKQLYEESKLMERKEKQIMRDTIKKNESKFGKLIYYK
jgi:protein regulator of cytokinesis 1